MVPMWSTTSCRDMPMPLSEIVIVRAAASKAMRIFGSGSSSNSAASASASKRSLSTASDAFDTSSRRKICDRARRGVEGDADLRIGVILEQRGVGQRFEAQLVYGVGRVRHQLAQEDL